MGKKTDKCMEGMKKPEAFMGKMFNTIGHKISDAPEAIAYTFLLWTLIMMVMAFTIRDFALADLGDLFRTQEVRERNYLEDDIKESWDKYGKVPQHGARTELVVVGYGLITNFTGQLIEAMATVLDIDDLCAYVEYYPTIKDGIYFRTLEGFQADPHKILCSRKELKQIASKLRRLSNYDTRKLRNLKDKKEREKAKKAIKAGRGAAGPLMGAGGGGPPGSEKDKKQDAALKKIGTGADAFEEMQKMLQKTKGRVLTTFAAKDANSTTQRWMIQKGEDVLKMRDPDIKMFRTAIYSKPLYDKEQNRAVMDECVLVAITVFLIVFFAIFISLNFHNFHMSRGTLAFAGTVMALLAIILGFSIGILMGLAVTLLALFIPFLVMAVGIDSSFVVIHTWLHEIEDNGHKLTNVGDLMGATMQECFLSVSLSDFTSILGFIVGVFSPFAAVNLCCAFLALNFFALWLCELFFFCPLLAVRSKLLLAKIKEAHPNRVHFGHCRKPNLGQKKKKDTPAELMNLNDDDEQVYVFNYYEKKVSAFFVIITKNKCVRFFWVLVFLVLVALGVWGTVTMKAYESIRDYLALDSQIHEFYKVVQEDPILPYLPNSVIIGIPNNFLTNKHFLGRIVALKNRLLKTPKFFEMKMTKTFDCFINYAASPPPKTVRELATRCNATGFKMDAYPDSKPNYMILTAEVRTAPDGDVEKEEIIVDAVLKVEEEFADINAKFYHMTLGMMMTRALLVFTLWTSVGSSLACSVVMLFIFVPEPLTIVMTLSMTFVTFIITLGLMSLAGLTYNSLTFMLSLVAMGVSIDYMAHSGRCYFAYSEKYDDPDERRSETMAEVSLPLFNSLMTSEIGMFVLFFSGSQAFKDLAVSMVLMFFLSFYSSLLVLPTLLFYFTQWGRACKKRKAGKK